MGEGAADYCRAATFPGTMRQISPMVPHLPIPYQLPSQRFRPLPTKTCRFGHNAPKGGWGLVCDIDVDDSQARPISTSFKYSMSPARIPRCLVNRERNSCPRRSILRKASDSTEWAWAFPAIPLFSTLTRQQDGVAVSVNIAGCAASQARCAGHL